MKAGDLVRHTPEASGDENRVGIITHLWVGGAASVLYEDGEYDVDSDDLEVISESRWGPIARSVISRTAEDKILILDEQACVLRDR